MTDREEIFDPVGTEKLDHATIMDWITTDGDDITVDTDKASAWVQEHIADKYDTLVTGYNFKFKATEDGEITLPIGSDGIYGWKTNVSATVEKLVDYIKAGEAVTIEPVYKVEGFRMNSNAGVTYTGNTYIEVDICHQHLWYYVNGELFLSPMWLPVRSPIRHVPHRREHTRYGPENLRESWGLTQCRAMKHG